MTRWKGTQPIVKSSDVPISFAFTQLSGKKTKQSSLTEYNQRSPLRAKFENNLTRHHMVTRRGIFLWTIQNYCKIHTFNFQPLQLKILVLSAPVCTHIVCDNITVCHGFANYQIATEEHESQLKSHFTYIRMDVNFT